MHQVCFSTGSCTEDCDHHLLVTLFIPQMPPDNCCGDHWYLFLTRVKKSWAWFPKEAGPIRFGPSSTTPGTGGIWVEYKRETISGGPYCHPIPPFGGSFPPDHVNVPSGLLPSMPHMWALEAVELVSQEGAAGPYYLAGIVENGHRWFHFPLATNLPVSPTS